MLRAMEDHPISQPRACVLIGVDPKTVRHERPPDDLESRLETNKIAEKRRWFGYRRIDVTLERKGMGMNAKKLFRIYREEGLTVRRRRGRKRARGSCTPMPVPLQPNVPDQGRCERTATSEQPTRARMRHLRIERVLASERCRRPMPRGQQKWQKLR